MIHRPILSHTQPPVVHKGRQVLSSPRSVLPHRGSGNRPAGVSADTACAGKGTGKGVRPQQDPRPGGRKAGARAGGGAPPHVRQPRSGPAPRRTEVREAAGATREELEKVGSGTFPGPREASGSPPRSRPQTPVPHHPGAPSQPNTSNDGCRPSRGARWTSWSPRPGVPANIQTGARGCGRRPGPRAPLCSAHLPLPRPDLDPEGCPEAQVPEQADPLLPRGGPGQEGWGHRPGTRGGAYRVGRSHARRRESLTLKPISLSPGHRGERHPELRAGSTRAPLPRRGWAPASPPLTPAASDRMRPFRPGPLQALRPRCSPPPPPLCRTAPFPWLGGGGGGPVKAAACGDRCKRWAHWASPAGR